MNDIDPGDTSGDVLAILQEQLDSRNKPTVVVESTVLIIFNIVALVGNAILCFIPYGNPKLRSSTTMLIVALACTDLLTAATVMPLNADAVINSRRRFSDGVCRFHAFAMAVFAQISIYLMALTAFNRASHNTQAGNNSEEVSVAKAVGSIVFAFTICWIPSEEMDTMNKINPLLLPRQVR